MSAVAFEVQQPSLRKCVQLKRERSGFIAVERLENGLIAVWTYDMSPKVYLVGQDKDWEIDLGTYEPRLWCWPNVHIGHAAMCIHLTKAEASTLVAFGIRVRTDG